MINMFVRSERYPFNFSFFFLTTESTPQFVMMLVAAEFEHSPAQIRPS